MCAFSSDPNLGFSYIKGRDYITSGHYIVVVCRYLLSIIVVLVLRLMILLKR